MKKSSKAPREAAQPQLIWHTLNSSRADGGFFKLGDVYRAKVPGGWLVLVANNARGLMFFPDARHIWNGGSLTA